MRWVSLPLIDGLSAQVRADQVVGIAPAAAFPDLCGPSAGDGSVVAVGNMLLRSTETVDQVWNRIVRATA
jgi:hypothetical protein